MTIIARTEFKGQSIKATDEVEPQSCRKSRNCRFLVILTIFKEIWALPRVLKILKIKFLNYPMPEFRPIPSIIERYSSRDAQYFKIVGPPICCFKKFV